MSITHHAPDPTHKRETLCGAELHCSGPTQNRLVEVGAVINCPDCRVVINFATKCVAPTHFVLARKP